MFLRSPRENSAESKRGLRIKVEMNREVQLISSNQTRLDKVSAVLRSLSLSFRVHRFLPAQDRVRGCLEAHATVFRWAVEQKHDYVWICEDNISTSPFAARHGIPHDYFDRLEAFLRDPKFRVNVVYVAAYFTPSFRSPRPCEGHVGIFETSGCHGASGYIVRRKFCRSLLRTCLDNGRAIDWQMEQCAGRYVITPLLFRRDLSIRSIVNPGKDTLRTLYFGEKVYDLCEARYLSGVYTVPHLTFAVSTVVLCVAVILYVALARSRQ